jgi:hypothetical protein
MLRRVNGPGCHSLEYESLIIPQYTMADERHFEAK